MLFFKYSNVDNNMENPECIAAANLLCLDTHVQRRSEKS